MISYKLRQNIFLLLAITILFLLLPYERMTGSSYIVLVFFGSLLSLGYYLTRDLASPQVIICVTWSISLFLTSLDIEFSNRISHFNKMLDAGTWILILAAISSFFFSCTLMMYPIRTRHRVTLGAQYLNWDPNDLDNIIKLSFSIALGVYLFAVFKNGGVPAFTDNVNEVRTTWVPGTFGVFLTLFQLVVIVTTLKIVATGVVKNRGAITLSLISIICSILTTQRIGAIEGILMALILFVSLWRFKAYKDRERQGKPIIYFGIIVLAIFVWGFVFIGQIRGLDSLQMTDLSSLVLEQLYIYFGGPAPRNLQMILEGGIYAGVHETKNGALFFRPLLWFLGFRDEVLLEDTFRGPNNATALFHYYIDLGLAGFFIFPLFWGGVCGFVYGCFRRSPTLRTGVIYAILANAIYFSPLSERFSEPSTFIKLVLFTVIISVVLITKRDSQKNE